jgi:hypothetical protein
LTANFDCTEFSVLDRAPFARASLFSPTPGRYYYELSAFDFAEGTMASEPHVAVIVVHGILSNDAAFAGPMIKGLRSRLGDITPRVHFSTIFWADKVRDPQSQFLGDIEDSVKYQKLRGYVVQGLGDAACYQKTSDHNHVTYFNVQNKIHDKVMEIDRLNRAQNREPCRLIFIAHSLGSHIVCSFLWDVNKLKQRPESYMNAKHAANSQAMALWKELNDKETSSFRKLDTLAGFVTIGSNIPLFTFAYDASAVYPITEPPTDHPNMKPAFPGAALLPEEAVAQNARWLNFYSKRDVLGYPVRPLYWHFATSKSIEDVCVETESLRSRLIPYWPCLSAHTGYWTNKTVLDRTAALIHQAAR